MPLGDLEKLKQIRLQLAITAKETSERLERERKAAELALRNARVFQDAVKDAVPLRVATKAETGRSKPEPRAVQFERDEQAALWQTLSDDMDIERLLDTDATLSYRRPGIGEDVTRKLRKGFWAIQEQIDLHGLRVEEAREALGEFFSQAVKKEFRCLRIIHGKGLGSVAKVPVLKVKVLRWLVQREEVLAFCQARPNDGGAGALIVLLNAKNRLQKTPNL